MYLNKVIIIGNLTRDPELKSLPSGIQVANIGVATNRVWKDKDGNKQEDTEFHNVVIFGRQAETTAQYLKKGSSVLIEGRLQTRSWESEGVKKYKTEIVAETVQFGPRKEGSSQGYQPAGNTAQAVASKEVPTVEYPEDEINPEDIPF
ncbi:single-stranded DNA-binding protein [Candidatus Campbellbacteria bacterium RIFCSPHIGHO2_12_FULL_35_10]|uniref:Single-stranded DNA-binding protein n=1 Tax=Candidatus Campbellbacteria bacterium RIFCSPHIGHO2_12_FULL_35_10 TaxID=1797578 RepID=A0A1F5ELI0_9BACT|nr:MAG: single-stranded DNA-binding protein [Candidatus Campbellbacteria bacterium RIFCSPHIGHO2_12_FULL_35_10]